MQQTKQTRFLALLLAVVLLIGLTPINAFATETEDPQETTTALVEETEAETEAATEEATEETTLETTQPEDEYNFPDVDSMTDAELLAYYAELSDEEAEAFALFLTEEQLQRLADLLYAVELCGESSDTHTVFKNTQSTLAPGVTQNIKYAYSADGKQMVYYIATADVTRDDVLVQSSYWKQYENGELGMSKLTDQVAYANKKYTNPEDPNYISDYYNVVAGVNSSFFNMTTGQPMGITFIDGVSFGTNSYDNFFAILKDGKTAVIDYAKNLSKYVDDNGESTIWQAAAGSQWLVRDGQDVTANITGSYNTERHSRTCVGITADGKVVLMVLDGRQEPFSCGGTMHELAQIMLEAGCVAAINLDGGGSTTFASKPEGENTFRVVNNPSDGSERSISAGIIIASTTAPSNVFDHVSMVAADEYVTPGTSTEITVSGVSPAGTTAEIPADVTYTVTNGTYENGVLTAEAAGDVTLTAKYNGVAVGSVTIHSVIPTAIAFNAEERTVSYEKTIDFTITATTDNGLHPVKYKDGDIVLSMDNEKLGTIDGLSYTAAAKDSELTGGVITATLVLDNSVTAAITVTLTALPDEPVIYEDFEDMPEYKFEYSQWYFTVRGEYKIVDKNTGKVHSGDHALAVTTELRGANLNSYFGGVHIGAKNAIYSNTGKYDKVSGTKTFEDLDLTNAKSLGMWIYIPEDSPLHYVQFRLTNKENSKLELQYKLYEYGYSTTESGHTGWQYFELDFDEVNTEDVTYNDGSFYLSRIDIYACTRNDTANQEKYGYNRDNQQSVQGPITFYFDDITVEYIDTGMDNEDPTFDYVRASYGGMSDSVAMNGQTISSNVVSVTARASDAGVGIDPSSARAYIDGVAVTSGFWCNELGIMTIDDVTLADGVHTFTFVISDRNGNCNYVTRQLIINAGSNIPTVSLKLAEELTSRPLFGQVIWMNMEVDDIENVNTISTRLNLNMGAKWELDHMVVAEGFEASYTIDSITNDAIITVKQTGNTKLSGHNVVVQIPVRMYYADPLVDSTDDPLGSQTVTPEDIKLSMDVGMVSYKDGTSSSFSMEKLDIDSEIYSWYDVRNANGDIVSGYVAHIHTANAMEDKAATCTESGYTGRTYCEVCHSVANWGTTIPAIGHTYDFVDGVLKCTHDGCDSLYNGVYTDGNTYVDGVVADGWVTIGDNTYYFVNGEKVTGAKYMDGVLYYFDENGVYDKDYVYSGFYTTDDGRLMYFVLNKYVTGYHRLFQKAYFFEDNGYAYDGEYTIGGETCLYKEGLFVSCSSANVLDAGLIGATAEYVLYADGTLHLSGTGVTYSFSDHGQRPYVTYATQVKKVVIGNGITRLGTYLSCYCSSMTEVEFEADSNLTQIGTGVFCECSSLKELVLPDSVAYISNMAFKSCPNLTKLILPANITSISNTAFQKSTSVTLYVTAGSYGLDYAKSNNIPYVLYEHEVKHEIVEVDGVLYYYEDGVLTYAGLILLDGDYYYVRSNGQLVVSRDYWVTRTNDLLPEGNYTFGADGKMVVDGNDSGEEEKPATDGIVDVDGVLYYYRNGNPYYAGLFQLDGSYYYARSNGQLVVSRDYWVTKTNDLLPAGTYTFGADGKIVVNGGDSGEETPPVISIVNVDGTLYCYKDGKAYYAGLFQLDGNYYYARSSGQLVVSRDYWVTKNNDLLPEGTYSFGADGKMVVNGGDSSEEEPHAISIVDVNGTLYCYKDGKTYYAGLFQLDGNYYYARSSGQLVVSRDYWVTKNNDLLPVATYTFDSEGKMIIE